MPLFQSLADQNRLDLLNALCTLAAYILMHYGR